MTILQCRYGEFFVPEREDLIINALREYGEWAQEELDLLSNFVRPGDTVLDIGTFIGTHARAFSQMVGVQGIVHAFEPNDLIYGALLKNSHLAFYQNIRTYQIALGASKHRSFILRNNNSSNLGATSLTDFHEKADHSAVEVQPLDEFNFPRVDFIKADVEGMEFDVLKGGEKTILQYRPIIFLETNSLQSTERVIEWGLKRNYVVFGTVSNAFNPDNYRKSTSNMFGEAKECGLLLIHRDRLIESQDFIPSLNLPVIETLDDLARLLVRKPQYVSDVLRLSAEELAHGHLAKLEALQAQLAATEAAKANAEELAHGHLAKLEALQAQLAATEAAKANAEELAFDRLDELTMLRGEIESIRQELFTTKCALNKSNKRIAKILDSKGYKLLATLRLVPTKDVEGV